MAKKPAAADLDYRATFKGPVFTNGTDADGQPINGYADEFTVWCGIQWKRGGEAVEQARMQSRSPAILTVRRSDDSRRITSEWRAVIDGRVFEVREDPTPTPDRGFLQMLAEG